jgi:hypothetical protein
MAASVPMQNSESLQSRRSRLLPLGERRSEKQPTGSEIRTSAFPESDHDGAQRAPTPVFGPGYRRLLAVDSMRPVIDAWTRSERESERAAVGAAGLPL